MHGERKGTFLKYLFNLNNIFNLQEQHSDNKLLFHKRNFKGIQEHFCHKLQCRIFVKCF